MKKLGIVFAVIAGIIILFVLIGVGANNSVVSQEETIYEMQSDIGVMVKHRNQTLTFLIDSIESYNHYEGETMTDIITARKLLEEGDFANASTIVNVVVERYPDLKSANNYYQYNNEVCICQNKINESERTYNANVRNYKSYVRRFPNNLYLKLFNYEVVDFELLDYSAENTAPLPSFSD